MKASKGQVPMQDALDGCATPWVQKRSFRDKAGRLKPTPIYSENCMASHPKDLFHVQGRSSASYQQAVIVPLRAYGGCCIGTARPVRTLTYEAVEDEGPIPSSTSRQGSAGQIIACTHRIDVGCRTPTVSRYRPLDYIPAQNDQTLCRAIFIED